MPHLIWISQVVSMKYKGVSNYLPNKDHLSTANTLGAGAAGYN